jgi:hypothetical protein
MQCSIGGRESEGAQMEPGLVLAPEASQLISMKPHPGARPRARDRRTRRPLHRSRRTPSSASAAPSTESGGDVARNTLASPKIATSSPGAYRRV